MIKKLCLAGVLTALGTVGANALVVLSDNFNSYTAGNLSTQGGWTATGTAVTTPIQAGGGVATLGTAGQDDYKALTSSVTHTDGNSIYSGLSINLSAVQAAGDYFFHLSNPAGTTSNFYERLFAKSTPGGYLLGLVDTSGTGSTITYGTGLLTLNTSYNIVIAWNFLTGGTNNDTFAVYVNPLSSTEGSNTAYLTHTWTSTGIAEPADIAAVNLRQGAAGNSATLTVDNIIIASSFAEVAAVPEPTTVSILLGGGIAMLVLRRRK